MSEQCLAIAGGKRKISSNTESDVKPNRRTYTEEVLQSQVRVKPSQAAAVNRISLGNSSIVATMYRGSLCLVVTLNCGYGGCQWMWMEA